MRNLIYRWRLWRICRKLKIKPMKWQKRYVLTGNFTWDEMGRETGKTTAVILYGLVRGIHTDKDIHNLAFKDPDTINIIRVNIFDREYRKYANKAGMKVKM